MGTRVEAHITGTVFRIETRVGAEVAAGDELVILESMKMEIPVYAPKAGKVAAIHVKPEQVVQEGDLIAEVE